MQRSHKQTWFMLSTVYMSQYLGISFFIAASVVVLRSLGLPLDKLALINLIILPIALKVCFALIVDHVQTFLAGRYRGWLLIAQSSMAILLVLISFIDIINNFYLALSLFFAYSVMTCFQDVAVDGLSCKIFPESRRQKVNAVQYASNLCGNIIGGGITLIFYDTLQWQGALLVLAALTVVSIIQLVFYVEPQEGEGDRGQVLHAETQKKLYSQIKFFYKTYKLWFIFLLILPIGFSSAYALINPMLVDLGWTIQDIGFVTKIYGSLLGIISALLIMPLIAWLGRIKTVQLLMLLQALSLLALPTLAKGGAGTGAVYLAIGLYSIVNPALLAAVSTLIMDKAALMKAKSTFFSLQLSLLVVMGFIYSAIAMLAANSYGYFAVVVSAIILSFMLAVVFALGLSVGVKQKS